MIGIFSVVLISRLVKPSKVILERTKPVLYKDSASELLSCRRLFFCRNSEGVIMRKPHNADRPNHLPLTLSGLVGSPLPPFQIGRLKER